MWGKVREGRGEREQKLIHIYTHTHTYEYMHIDRQTGRQADGQTGRGFYSAAFGWPGICSADQTGFRLSEIFLSLSPNAAIKAHATMFSCLAFWFVCLFVKG